jgi:hypothetical protein
MARSSKDLIIPVLTDDMRASFPAFVEEWTAVGRSTEPMDRAEAAAGMVAAYAAAGLPAPRMFFGVSPIGGAVMRRIIVDRLKAGPKSEHVGVRDGVGDGVRGGVRAGVWGGVRGGVRLRDCEANKPRLRVHALRNGNLPGMPSRPIARRTTNSQSSGIPCRAIHPRSAPRGGIRFPGVRPNSMTATLASFASVENTSPSRTIPLRVVR